MGGASSTEARTDTDGGAAVYLRVATWTIGFWLLICALGALSFGVLTVGILTLGVLFVQFPVALGLLAYGVGLVLAGRRCRLRGMSQWATAVVASAIPVAAAALGLVLALTALDL